MNGSDDNRKKEFSCISNNQRNLENFALSNYKFRLLIYDLIYAYTICDQNEMQKCFSLLKEKIRRIDQTSQQFIYELAKLSVESSHQITLKSLNQFIINRNKEAYETQYLNNSMPKMTFVSEIFKGLFDINEDTIIKEFIKDDYCQCQLKNSISFKNINGIEADYWTIETLIKEVLGQFPKLKLTSNDSQKQVGNIPDISMTIKIPGSFKVIIRLIHDDKKFKFIRMCVSGLKENSTFANMTDSRENKIMPIQRKMSDYDKSHMKVFRKLNVLFEDKLKFLLKPKHLMLKCLTSLFIFIKYISEYIDLFKKKCHYCDKIVKYNTVENCFFPPYYRLFDLKLSYFFHEECFAILYNNAA